MMISHHRMGDKGKGNGLDRVSDYILTIQPMVTPEPDRDISYEDFTVNNPSSPSAGPPPSAEQRDRSRRDERSRSRVRVPPHSSSHASQQPQLVVPPSGVQQTQTLATQDADEDSATVDPQNRVSDHSRSPQGQEDSRRQGPQTQKGKNINAEKQPRTPPKVKKHKSWIQMRAMKNLTTSLEPFQTLNLLYQYYLFIKNQQPVRKDQQPAGSFCFVTTENGDQQGMCNLTTMPCVQRSLYLNVLTDDFGSIKFEVPKGVDGRTRDMLERCMATCGRAAGTRAHMRSRARKEASAQEVRGCYKPFSEAKHLEYRSWVDNEVFDLTDLRKAKPQNYVTGRWVLTIKTDKQGDFLQGKSQMGTERFPGQTEGISTDGFPCIHNTQISDELPNGRQQKLEHLSL